MHGTDVRCTARMYGCNFPPLRHFWPCICLCRTSLPSGGTDVRTDVRTGIPSGGRKVTCYVLRVTCHVSESPPGGRNLRHSSIRPSDPYPIITTDPDSSRPKCPPPLTLSNG